MDDPLIELLENAFGAGYDHARNGIWSWTKEFENFLSDFCEEIKDVRETMR